MRILYISQYFHPEIGATTNRAVAIIREMKARGHRVTVLCEMPNHPHGVIFPGYKGKFCVKEKFDGMPVIHLPVVASPNKNFISRILMYLSFSLSAMVYMLCKRPRYDLLYVSSPPLFVCLCGLLAKLIHPRRRFVFEVRDLWPDSAVELGELNNKFLIRFSTALEKKTYASSDLVVAATNYIGRVVVSKGTDPAKVFVSRNGVDDIILDSYSEASAIPSPEVFTAIFAGNMGLAQDLEPVIRCAWILKEEPLRFVFIGGGPCAQDLRKLAQELDLKNVDFREMIPKAEMGKVLAEADCGIVCLKDLPVMSGALPVKIFDYMAYKLPVICGIKGEAAEVVSEAGAGIVVPPGDSLAMASALRKLLCEPQTVASMGESGREYVLKNFRRAHLAGLLVAEISRRFPPSAFRS